MLQCAIECSNDENCAAWSFKNTNVLGNAEYTCNLMSEVLCTRSEQDHGDPRTIYHVKNSKIQELFAEYEVSTIARLEAVKFSVESEHIFNVWSSWGYHNCFTKQENGEKCGVGFQKRLRTTIQGNVEVDRRDCIFANTVGEMVECTPDQGETEAVVGHGWMDWGNWSPCTQSCGSNGFKKRTRRCGKSRFIFSTRIFLFAYFWYLHTFRHYLIWLTNTHASFPVESFHCIFSL